VADHAQVSLQGQDLKGCQGRDIRNLDDIRSALASLKSTEPWMAGHINFAGLKAAGESVRLPLDQRDVNVTSSRCLF
jgi:hypothetical protein